MITGGERIWCPPRHGEIVAPPLEAYAPRWDRRGVSRRGGGASAAVDFPATLSPLVWLEARDATAWSIVEDAEGITSITDRGSSGIVYTQTVDARQVTRPASVNWGSQPVFTTDANNSLSAAAPSSGIPLAEDGSLTVVAVGRSTVTALRYFWGNEGFTNPTGAGFRHSARVGGGSVSAFADGTAAIQHTGGDWALDTNRIFRIEFRGSASPGNDEVEHFLDGVSTGAATTGDLAAAISSGDKSWNFLSRLATPADAFEGEMAFFAIFPGILSAGDKAGMLDYINDTYSQAFAGF